MKDDNYQAKQKILSTGTSSTVEKKGKMIGWFLYCLLDLLQSTLQQK